MSAVLKHNHIDELLPSAPHGGRFGADAACLAGAHTDLPLFVVCRSAALAEGEDAFIDWFDRNLDSLNDLLDESGAVVLRGFAIGSTAAFARLAERYPPHSHGYVAGATPRGVVSGKVFEPNRIPPNQRIGLHQEKAYMGYHPRRIAFFCQQPSPVGGETIIGDFARVCRDLPPELVEHFSTRKICYMRNFRNPEENFRTGLISRFREYHRPWDEAFMTTERSGVEQACAQTGLDFEWQADGSVTVSHTGPAVIAHPISGERVWFNQISTLHANSRSMGPAAYRLLQQLYARRPALPYDIRYGDRSVVSLEELEPVYEAIDAHTVAFPWQAGDVMLLDNLRVAHGRNPFEGPRNVQVAMFD